MSLMFRTFSYRTKLPVYYLNCYTHLTQQKQDQPRHSSLVSCHDWTSVSSHRITPIKWLWDRHVLCENPDSIHVGYLAWWYMRLRYKGLEKCFDSWFHKSARNIPLDEYNPWSPRNNRVLHNLPPIPYGPECHPVGPPSVEPPLSHGPFAHNDWTSQPSHTISYPE